MIRRLPSPFKVILNSLTDWWYEWVNLAVINVLWMLCWLTIVLGPPATMGVYYAAQQLVDGRGISLADVIEGGRRYFVKGWLWALPNAFVAVLAWANFIFYGQLGTDWAPVLLVWSIGLTLLWLAVQFYALPYFMEQEQKKLRLALRNGLLTVLANPFYTLVVAGFSLLVLILSVLVVALVFLGGPVLVVIVGTRAVRERLETYGLRERKPESVEQSDKFPNL